MELRKTSACFGNMTNDLSQSNLLWQRQAGSQYESTKNIRWKISWAVSRRRYATRPLSSRVIAMSVVASLSSWITVLARGRVLAEGDYATVSKDPRVIEAYIGVGHA